MVQTAADTMIESLLDWGVEIIFGMPGDGNNGLIESLRKRQDKIRFIHVRHEESAAFMASAYAKYTGKLGVCMTTGGPGAIHLLNGLYDAKVDHQPVLAITGNTQHDLMNTHGQQDVWLDHLFSDVAVYSTRIMGSAHVEVAVDYAVRHALAERGVAHITFPIDLQLRSADSDSHSFRNLPHHTSDTYADASGIPSETDLQRAANVLNAGKRVAILVGVGALGAAAELEQVADLLGAPVAKALLGKAVLPDDSPFTTGTIGYLGTLPTQYAMDHCDTLLMVGTNFPYAEFLPRPGQARGVQIEWDSSRVGMRYPVEVGVVGDARQVLQALIPLLKHKIERSFLEKAQKGMQDWHEKVKKEGTDPATPMKPHVVAWTLGKLLKENAIVSCDSGNIAHWWARHIPVKAGQMHSISGNLGSMGCSVPYTLAAQIAYPDRQCVAVVGDGGFAMMMGEFATAAKYNLPIKVVVFKNNRLGAITWEQLDLLGNPEFSTELNSIDFAGVARACGAAGFTVDNPADMERVLEEALAYPGPALVEAVIANTLPDPIHVRN
jgi:pyruvate dehydrogenase (quinone)